MKVAIVSSYENRGGAAISALRLHQGLLEADHNSKMFVLCKDSDDPTIITATNQITKFKNRIRPFLDRIPLLPGRPKESFSTGLWSNSWIIRELNLFNPDVVHLQWVNHGFVPLKTMSEIKYPIIWRLPDWWLLTAGCHLPYACDKYYMGCNYCPKITTLEFLNRSAYFFSNKKRYVQKNENLTIVAPSSSLAQSATNSPICQSKPVRVIPNGLNLSIIKKESKEQARIKLGIDLESKIILFGAIGAHVDPNKGFDLLMNAIRYFIKSTSLTKVKCLSFGSIASNFSIASISIESLGYISDNNFKNSLYTAADVMIVPSYQESFGQTAIEAMACATPVVSFATTGLLDIVIHKHNGYLATAFDSEDLGRGIEFVLTHSNYHYLSTSARKTVEDKFTIQKVVEKYVELYQEVSIGKYK